MERREGLLPEAFGPLQGVRILSTGNFIAQPWAATLAGEMGAEVVQVERPEGDFMRTVEWPLPTRQGGQVGSLWVQERRCAFYISLDLSRPRGRDLFLRLLPHFDIWMESSPPGVLQRWGLDDQRALSINPRLVIVHVSGYGQTGHPDYLGRTSYDLIGQAFGGMMYLTGFPDPDPPVRAAPWTGDYITALFCLWSALAGYIHAQRTGRGQAIDVAQYEAVHRCLAGTMVAYFQLGIVRERGGNRGGFIQPYDTYQASDGWVVIAVASLAVFDRLCRVLGLGDRDAGWKRSAHTEPDSEPWMEFDALLRSWVLDRTIREVEETLNRAGVPCSRIMNAREMAQDPHYQARGVHTEWEDLQVGRVKGIGVIPRFLGTPGRVWRGSVPVGYDNTLVYSRLLGLSPQDLEELKREGVI